MSLYTTKQTAELFHTSISTITGWAKCGLIPHQQLSSKVLVFDSKALKEWAETPMGKRLLSRHEPAYKATSPRAPQADRILAALESGPKTRTQIAGLFSRTAGTSRQTQRVLDDLIETGRIKQERTGGGIGVGPPKQLFSLAVSAPSPVEESPALPKPSADKLGYFRLLVDELNKLITELEQQT